MVEDFRDIGEADFRTSSYMSSKNSEGEKRVMLQTDYFHPLGEAGSFELGSRFTLREIFNNYLTGSKYKLPKNEYIHQIAFSKIHSLMATKGDIFPDQTVFLENGLMIIVLISRLSAIWQAC